MRICGFTFVRNALKYAYPVVESICSVLPVVDKMIVNVGYSEDGTLELIQSIESDKIEIIQSIWDESLRKNGQVLAVETNKAFDAIPPDYDWAFYIQADEVIHEKHYENIRQSLARWTDQPQVEGLLFTYTHFYGTYDYVGDSRNWYTHEIRIIRNNKKIRSYKDAQGFRIENRKLRVKPADASIFHYGWVKTPEQMKEKLRYFNSLWHNQEWIDKKIPSDKVYDFSEFESLSLFAGTHPAIMRNRIESLNCKVSFDSTQRSMPLKDRLLYYFERITGYRLFEYKNYKQI